MSEAPPCRDSAKPIIDFDVIIESYDVFQAVAARLKEIGYIHEGDLGVPGRECFKKDVKEDFMPYHMYVCPKDSRELQRHIQFRDYLRNHDETRDEYAKLKKSLAEKYRHDIDSYIEGKHEFVETVLKKAREGKQNEQD
jgi:GrpB-like predicted nucleotidyltransferase (UPF0157 family)